MSVVVSVAKPKIVLITEIVDGGPGGAVSCPHCGSLGRWVTFFACEDGQKGGAMNGCIKLWPITPFAEKCRKLLLKQKQAIATEGNQNSIKLNHWNMAQLDAIYRFSQDKIGLEEAIELIHQADRDKKGWMKKRGYCR